MGMGVSTQGLTGEFGNPFSNIGNYTRMFQQPQVGGYQSGMGQLSPGSGVEYMPDQQVYPGGNQTDLPTQTNMNFGMLTPSSANQEAVAINHQMPEANADGGQMYNMQLGNPITTETLPTGLSGLQQQLSPVTQPAAGFSGRSGYGGGNERFQTPSAPAQRPSNLAGSSPGTKTGSMNDFMRNLRPVNHQL